MAAMSSGSIRPSRWEFASLSSAALPGNSFRTRSVIVAEGAMALTRTFGANSTAMERVMAATAPLAAV